MSTHLLNGAFDTAIIIEIIRIVLISTILIAMILLINGSNLAEVDSQGFLKMQHDFIKSEYYDRACKYLDNEGFHADNHSNALKDVIWSRAVQYGPGNVVDLFNQALSYVPGYSEEWNLSWVDALRFDYDLIVGIYESNKSDEWISPRLSDDVRQGVYDRMDHEKQEALSMFMKEI